MRKKPPGGQKAVDGVLVSTNSSFRMRVRSLLIFRKREGGAVGFRRGPHSRARGDRLDRAVF